MKCTFYLIVILLVSNSLNAQKEYQVISSSANMRTGPGKEFDIIATYSKGDVVTLIEVENTEWWLVERGQNRGYMYASLLSKQTDETSKWQKKNYESGSVPDCENIAPYYDYEIDNYLKVKVGSSTDVVVKVMQKSNYGQDICIRIAYVRGGDSYYIRNIPQGIYYLKLAYGKDWQQKVVDNLCYGKFMKNSRYEKGTELLNYYITKTYNGEQVPSYELQLDVVGSKFERSSYHSNNINENEFNK